MNYRGIGDGVNLAARLSNKASARAIWVDLNIFEELKTANSRASTTPSNFSSYQGYTGLHPTYRSPTNTRTKLREAQINLERPELPDMALTATQTAEAASTLIDIKSSVDK